MALTGTIQANLVANLTKFSAPMRKAGTEVMTLEKRLKGLQSTAKLGFGILAGTSINRFLKGTLKDATTLGSQLQLELGDRGVKAAEQLASAFDKIHLALQKTLVQTLEPMLPLLQQAAKFAAIVAETISGGPVGKLAEVNKLGGVNVNTGVQAAIAELIARRTALERQRAGVGKDLRGILLNDPNEPFAANLRQQLDDKIAQLTLEIGALQLNRSPVAKAVEAAKNPVPGFDVIGLFQKLRFTRNAAGALGDFATGGISPLTDLSARLGGGAAGLLGRGAENRQNRIDRIAGQIAQTRDEIANRRTGFFERGTQEFFDEIKRIQAAERGESGEDIPELIDVIEKQFAEEQKVWEKISSFIDKSPDAARF